MVGAGTSTPSDERSGEGARGKGRQRPPPSSSPAGERKGARGKVRERPPPSSPPAGERKGAGGKVRERRRHPSYALASSRPAGRLETCPYRCGNEHAERRAKRCRGEGEGKAAPSPFLAPSGGEEGGWGEGEGRQPCAAVPALQPVHPCSIHQDAGQRPALPARNHCVSNFRRSFSSAPHGGAEGGWGKGRQRPPPFSPPAGERKGAGGKVRAASRAPQYQRCNRCPPVPSRCGPEARAPSTQPSREQFPAFFLFRPHPPPSSPPAGERKGAGGKVRAARRALPAPALQPVPPCSIKMRARGPPSQHATIA